MPFERRDLLAIRRVPDLQRVVLTAAGELFVVGTECQVPNLARMTLERQDFLACRRVPDLDRLAFPR